MTFSLAFLKTLPIYYSMLLECTRSFKLMDL